MTVEKYKDFIKALDALQREDARNNSLDNENSGKCDELCDLSDTIWYRLTQEEKNEVGRYSVQLRDEWTPLEKYNEAVRIVEGFTKPCANKDHWIKKRDEALAQINGDT